MTKIRIYKLPKGYIDVECDSVSICPVLGGHKAIINGGDRDDEVIPNEYGAKILKEKK